MKFSSGLVVALIAALSSSGIAQPYSELVVFSDSFADVGNGVARYPSVAPSPPYFYGRWTNGPNFIDRLAELLEIPSPTPSERGGTNYAWASATTGSKRSGNVDEMDTQVEKFLAENEPRADQLFVLWGGGNDFFQGQTDPEAPVRFIGQHIAALASNGAKNFLVGNMPSPDKDFWQPTSKMASEFNSHLTQELSRVSSELAINVFEFDMASVITRITNAPSSFGFVDVSKSACTNCETGAPTISDGLRVVANPDEYLFFDDVHFSSRVHKIIGDAAFAALPPNAKPPSIPLIPKGSTWSYSRGTSEPSPFPELAWTTSTFNDSAWEKGSGGFGFGDANDLFFVATVLEDMVDNYGSLYLRHKFEVDDPRSFSSLKLDVNYDDAFIAYINGVEVARSDFGEIGQPIAHDGTGVRVAGHQASLRDVLLIDLDDYPDLLWSGHDNVVAIHGLNRRVNDDDFVIAELRLSAVVVPEPSTGVFLLLGSITLLSAARRRSASCPLPPGANCREQSGPPFQTRTRIRFAIQQEGPRGEGRLIIRRTCFREVHPPIHDAV